MTCHSYLCSVYHRKTKANDPMCMEELEAYLSVSVQCMSYCVCIRGYCMYVCAFVVTVCMYVCVCIRGYCMYVCVCIHGYCIFVCAFVVTVCMYVCAVCSGGTPVLECSGTRPLSESSNGKDSISCAAKKHAATRSKWWWERGSGGGVAVVVCFPMQELASCFHQPFPEVKTSHCVVCVRV